MTERAPAPTAVPSVGPTVLRTGPVDASPPPGGGDRERLRIGSSQVLIALSLLIAWFLLYTLVLSGFEQAHGQDELYGELRTGLAEGTAPTGAPIAPGSPVALLSIPDAGVSDVVVVEGSRSTQLQQGPGHVLGSVLPGQQGISVVAGRSVSFGAPFGELIDLQRGAPITVTTAQGIFRYEVTGLRLKGDPVPPAPASGQGRLTLVTAARGTGLAALQPSQTLYVDAVLADGAVAPGPVSTADPGLDLMSGSLDTATLGLLALSLQLLVAALAGFVWAWHRWSTWGAWIAGVPCVLATLWLTSSVAARMLPALI
jgi:sortase A